MAAMQYRTASADDVAAIAGLHAESWRQTYRGMMSDAYLDHAPLVALTGQADLERMHKESHQFIDLVELFRPITKWNARVTSPDIVPEEVRKAFKGWVTSRWFAPSSLKKVGSTEQLTGTYLPHWTYDSATATNYTGERGEHYWVTETYTENVNGQQVTGDPSLLNLRAHQEIVIAQGPPPLVVPLLLDRPAPEPVEALPVSQKAG